MSRLDLTYVVFTHAVRVDSVSENFISMSSPQNRVKEVWWDGDEGLVFFRNNKGVLRATPAGNVRDMDPNETLPGVSNVRQTRREDARPPKG